MSCYLHCSCGENSREINSDRANEMRTLPFLSITSPVSNIPHLANVDIDKHMPLNSNFGYYTAHEFHSNNDIIQCLSHDKAFSALHCNIRSLAANHDNFLHLISELSHKFPLIGLSETKISIDKEPIPNINIPGYTFISEPSHSNAGGVAFYINDNLKFFIKSNYTKSTYDFEALWIEIDFANQSNIICGVIYRHPSGNLDNFMDYINSTIESINQENKFCLFMGDFNIDLLKIDSHSDSQNFINSLGSCFFQPQIFQLTRITDHSATLIDNNYIF